MGNGVLSGLGQTLGRTIRERLGLPSFLEPFPVHPAQGRSRLRAGSRIHAGGCIPFAHAEFPGREPK